MLSMFNTKFIISTTIFITLLILTSAIKNKTRILEKKITNINFKILSKKKDVNEGQLDFYYLSSPAEVEKRLELYNFLKEKNILAQIHYIPCHLMPYYRDKGYKEGNFPVSENYYKHCISLPIFPNLTQKEQNFVINKVNEFYG